MNNLFKIKNYFLDPNQSLNIFFQKKKLMKAKKGYYDEISLFLKKCINNPKR